MKFTIEAIGKVVSRYEVEAKTKNEARKKFQQDKDVDFVESDEIFDEKIVNVEED